MIVTGNEFSENTGTDQKNRMAEMAALLQRARYFISETDDPSWHRGVRAILAPAPDPDALLDTICDVWWAGKAGADRIAAGNGKRWLLTFGTHEGDAIVRGMRAIAAWVEADRVQVRHTALTEAADAVEHEYLRRRVMALQDGGKGS